MHEFLRASPQLTNCSIMKRLGVVNTSTASRCAFIHISRRKIMLRRALGQALVAAHGGGARAERTIRAPQHMAVGRADGEKFMRREDDPGARQHLARQAQIVDAEGHEMVEMHHVGLRSAAKTRANDSASSTLPPFSQA